MKVSGENNMSGVVTSIHCLACGHNRGVFEEYLQDVKNRYGAEGLQEILPRLKCGRCGKKDVVIRPAVKADTGASPRYQALSFGSSNSGMCVICGGDGGAGGRCWKCGGSGFANKEDGE